MMWEMGRETPLIVLIRLRDLARQ